MSRFKTALLTGAAGLAFSFGATAQPAGPTADIAAEVKTVTTHYNTKSSKALAALEAQINNGKPAGTPKVVFIDTDHLSTWMHINRDLRNFDDAINFYIGDKTKAQVDPTLVFNVSKSTVNAQTIVFHPHTANPALAGKSLEAATCVIVPYFPNQRAIGHLSKQLTITNPETGAFVLPVVPGMIVDPGINETQMEKLVNSREAFRCLDTNYTKFINRGATANDTLVALHKAQVFADVGSLMLAIHGGEEPALAEKFAHYRNTQIGITEKARMLALTPTHQEFYGSITYSTAPALLELKEQIQTIGLAQFRTLPLTSLVTMAKVITEKSALTPKEVTHVLGYMVQGDKYFTTIQNAPAEVAHAKQFLMMRDKMKNESAEAILRAPTAAEKQQVERLTPQMLTEILERHILQSPEVLLSGGKTEAKLAAREKLVDGLRDMIISAPDKAGHAAQLLQGVTQSDPLVRLKKSGKAPEKTPGISV